MTQTMTTAARTLTPVAATLLMGALLVAAFTLVPHDAWAAKAKGIQDMSRNVGRNFSYIPKLVATISYVAGTFFAASGLIKLKDWMIEGDKVGVMPALMRFFLAAMLIMLPHAILVVTNSFFGDPEDAMPDVEFKSKSGKLNAFDRSK